MQLLPDDVEQELTGELVCYARSVAGVQWQRMEDGTLGDDPNPWADEMFYTLRTIEPSTNAEQAAYEAWLTQNGARIEARNDRIHGAQGVIPIAAVDGHVLQRRGSSCSFMLFFVDRGEGPVVQGFLMGPWWRRSPRCCACSPSSTTRSTTARAGCNRSPCNEC